MHGRKVSRRAVCQINVLTIRNPLFIVHTGIESGGPERVFDPFEASFGLRHRDIIHMLEILGDAQAPTPNKIKALPQHGCVC
jgi:hypothetical protein